MYLDKYVSDEQRRAKEMLMVDWKPALIFSGMLALGAFITLRVLGLLPVIGGLAGWVVLSPLFVGTKGAFFRYMDGQKDFDAMQVLSIYKDEKELKRNALVAGRVYLYTMVWSMLLVIPGIIKGYALFMTPFLASEHKHLEPKKAMELSQRMMMGHKMELFRMYLGFSLWFALSAVTSGIGGIVV